MVIFIGLFDKLKMIPTGELGFGAIYGEDHKAVFVSALPPARNITDVRFFLLFFFSK